MLRWNNDYNHGAHPAILKAFEETNDESYPGYGLDSECERAAAAIQKYLKTDRADIHFMLGGTQANYTVIAHALRPWQGVIGAESAHINVHETGAVEHIGHKIHALHGENGKLSAETIRAEAENYRISTIPEHVTQPKMVYLSQPTEYGTLYSLQELRDVRRVCDEYGLYLYVDGARLGYALGSDENDVTLADLAALTDAFYIGGTKCGCMFGEAVVVLNDELKDHFRNSLKQNGGMLAKGWTLGVQFAALFENGLYFDITRQATQAAMRIRDAFRQKGIPFYYESPTNQQFVVVDHATESKLAENHIFEFEARLDEAHDVIRFCTSWSTKSEDVDTLVADILAL